MPRDFSHLTAKEHEEMRQNDITGEHGRWEDRGAEHAQEVEEKQQACEGAGHHWAEAGGGLLICLICEAEQWADEKVSV